MLFHSVYTFPRDRLSSLVAGTIATGDDDGAAAAAAVAIIKPH